MTNSARRDGPAVDLRHLLVIGAGPGLGGAIAHRFAQGGYHLTLLARRSDELAKLEAGPSCSPAAAGRTTQARPGAPCHSARPRCGRRRPCSVLICRATAYASPASRSPGRSGRAHRSARTRLQKGTGRSCNQRTPGKANSASTEREPRALAHHLARTAYPVLARLLAAHTIRTTAAAALRGVAA